MLKSLLILFTKVNPYNSEEFVSANIKEVSIEWNGMPNILFLAGMKERDLYDEARRLFGEKECKDGMTQEKFEQSSYSLVVDFRTVNEKSSIREGTWQKHTVESNYTLSKKRQQKTLGHISLQLPIRELHSILMSQATCITFRPLSLFAPSW